MAGMSGSAATSFIVPLLSGISLLTFALTLIISLSPTEDEITADAVLQRRMETEFSSDLHVNNPASGSAFGGTSGAGGQYPHGAPGSGLHAAPGSVPRSSLVWSRQPRVGSEGGHRRYPRNPSGQ